MLTSVVVFISRIGKAKIIAKLNTSKNFQKAIIAKLNTYLRNVNFYTYPRNFVPFKIYTIFVA